MDKRQFQIQEATRKWVQQFNQIPNSVFEKLKKNDPDMEYYDSDTLRLVASPSLECSECGKERGITEDVHDDCVECGEPFRFKAPSHFPCSHGFLYSPGSSLDVQWIKDNLETVASLGFFVFESEDFDLLLGIDGGGYCFEDAHWIPLYQARGLRWHER